MFGADDNASGLTASMARCQVQGVSQAARCGQAPRAILAGGGIEPAQDFNRRFDVKAGL